MNLTGFLFFNATHTIPAGRILWKAFEKKNIKSAGVAMNLYLCHQTLTGFPAVPAINRNKFYQLQLVGLPSPGNTRKRIKKNIGGKRTRNKKYSER